MTEANCLPTSASSLQPPRKAASTARCACGHDRSHPSIAAEPIYNHLGWLMFLIGVTARPRRVVYRCLWCKHVLASTRDPKVLGKFD